MCAFKRRALTLKEGAIKAGMKRCQNSWRQTQMVFRSSTRDASYYRQGPRRKEDVGRRGDPDSRVGAIGPIIVCPLCADRQGLP